MGPAGVFKGDRPVITDGHWELLSHARCWFKDDKDLAHLPQQKQEQNKGSPIWKGPGLLWPWDPVSYGSQKAVSWVLVSLPPPGRDPGILEHQVQPR